MSEDSVLHWSELTRRTSKGLDVLGHIAPSEKHPGNLQEGFSQTQVSIMAVKDKILVASGFQGELIFKHSSLSPDGKLLVVVGNNPERIMIDSHSGKAIHYLEGRLDYSFAPAWNPDGRTFATGNQDKTCRVWDARNLSKSVAVLRANLGAIRSIRFSSDGRFMAMAEPADFVHIFDVGGGDAGGYEKRQELDY